MIKNNNKVTKYSKVTSENRSKVLRNPDEILWRQVKAQAALEGVTLTQWVEEAIKIRLAKDREK